MFGSLGFAMGEEVKLRKRAIQYQRLKKISPICKQTYKTLKIQHQIALDFYRTSYENVSKMQIQHMVMMAPVPHTQIHLKHLLFRTAIHGFMKQKP